MTVPHIFGTQPAGNVPASYLDVDFSSITGGMTPVSGSTVLATGSTTLRTLGDRFAEFFNVKDYGAVGGLADDTIAFQAAVTAASAFALANASAGAAVYIPPGIYQTTSAVTLTQSGVGIIGAGPTQTLWLNNTANTHTLVLGSSTIQTVTVEGIRFYSTMTDPGSSGAHIHMLGPELCFLNNLLISGKFNGLLVEGGLGNTAVNLWVTAGAFWTGRKTGSSLIRFTKSGSQAPAGWTLTNVNANGDGGNSFIDDAILIEAADGIQFSNFHAGFCGQSQLHIKPASGSVDVGGVKFAQGYFDGFFGSTSVYGVLIENPNTNTGDLDGPQFVQCDARGFFSDSAVRVTADASAFIAIDWVGGIIGGSGSHAIHLTGGSVTMNVNVVAGDVLIDGTAASSQTATVTQRATAWTAYSPTITSATGTITSFNSVVATYWRVGPTVSFDVTININVNGSGATAVLVPLPFTAKRDFVASASNSAFLSCAAVSTSFDNLSRVKVTKYDSSYPGADSTLIWVSGTYEAA